MENNSLNKNEYEDLSKLINITIKIVNLYNKLYQLELNEKKQTKEYNLFVSKLKQCLTIENNIYNQIMRNLEENKKIIYYLTEKYNKELIHQNYSNQLLKLDEMMIITRIISKLSRNFMNNFDKTLSQEKAQLYHSIYNSIKTKNIIFVDIVKCFLPIVSEITEKQSDLNITKYLKKIKYATSCIYQEIEKEMIISNFEINKNPYISYKFFGQMNGWPLELINEVTKVYCIEFYTNILNSMLVYDDKDLLDKSIMAEMLINQSFLRAIYLLLDDETIMDLNSEFHDLIDDDDYQSILNNREIVIDLIIKSYKKVKFDKSIPKIISLKL